MNRERTGPTGHIHADIGIIYFFLLLENYFSYRNNRDFFAPGIIFLAYQNNYFVKKITFAKKSTYFVLCNSWKKLN